VTLKEQRLQAAESSGGISSEVIYDRILKVIGDYHLRGRALDYGAGIGNFTRKLSASGRFEQIDGADILPRPENLPSAILWHRLDLNDADAIPEASFDVVIAAEVIEHLENPRQVAREWFRILKPGGTLILSTPNNESIRSLMALLVRGHYVAFLDSCYPAHITALLRKESDAHSERSRVFRHTLPLHRPRGLAKIASGELAAGFFRAAQGVPVQRQHNRDRQSATFKRLNLGTCVFPPLYACAKLPRFRRGSGSP